MAREDVPEAPTELTASDLIAADTAPGEISEAAAATGKHITLIMLSIQEAASDRAPLESTAPSIPHRAVPAAERAAELPAA